MRREEREDVEDAIRTAAKHAGYEVLSLRCSNDRRVIATIDRDGPPITISDATAVNYRFRDAITAAGFSSDDFAVEVESPGPNRPLLNSRHFIRVEGERARIKAKAPLPDGQVVVVGLLAGVDGDAVLVKTGKGAPLRIPFDCIADARLHP